MDRNQVIHLTNGCLPRVSVKDASAKPLVRFDLWVGLIGTRRLTREDAEWVQATLKESFLPDLLEAHPEHHITLLSPLAPGGDLVAARALLEALNSRKTPHRLLVTETVPVTQVIAQFEPLWHEGAVGDSALALDNPSWPDARNALAAAIAQVPRERLIELDPVALGATQADCEGAYRRQNAYIIQRVHILVAIVKPPTSEAPGGTGEAIAWRGDPSGIPATMPSYARRPNLAAQGFPDLVIIDAADRKLNREVPPTRQPSNATAS